MKDYDLMQLCIQKKWFTCGTTTQYNKMFKINNNGAIPLSQSEHTLDRVAFAIWLCSDTDNLHLTIDDIKATLLGIEKELLEKEDWNL